MEAPNLRDILGSKAAVLDFINQNPFNINERIALLFAGVGHIKPVSIRQARLERMRA